MNERNGEEHYMQPIQGIHHITAIASSPQANLDFYHNLLGQRFVKRTVNFDDPGSYHLYYGDLVGSPGTIMTFFAWPGARRGTVGNGEISAPAYAVGSGSLDFWRRRLEQRGVSVGEVHSRFGAQVLPLRDQWMQAREDRDHPPSDELFAERGLECPNDRRGDHGVRGDRSRVAVDGRRVLGPLRLVFVDRPQQQRQGDLVGALTIREQVRPAFAASLRNPVVAREMVEVVLVRAREHGRPLGLLLGTQHEQRGRRRGTFGAFRPTAADRAGSIRGRLVAGGLRHVVEVHVLPGDVSESQRGNI